MAMKQILRITGIGLLSTAIAAVVGVLFVRDQMSRHRRDLFSSRPLRRLAALGYIAGRPASVDSVRLLRDYIAWETQPLIRRQAVQVLGRIERSLQSVSGVRGEAAG